MPDPKENFTPEQLDALEKLHAANLKAQADAAAKQEAEEKRRANRFHIAIRGFAKSHHSGDPADLEAMTKTFVEQLRAAGHDAHFAESGCGDVGHEKIDTF